MANMSYCRMRNTLSDLRACYESWDDTDGDEELRARNRLLELCEQIVADYSPAEGSAGHYGPDGADAKAYGDRS